MHNTVATLQAARLAVDIAGMRGPFRVRDVVDSLYRQHGDRLFSIQDEGERNRLTWRGYVFKVMKQQVDAETVARLDVPRKHMHVLDDLPLTICISASGDHILSINATAENWDANSSLKRGIGDQVIAAADVPRDMSRFLRESGRTTLADFTKRAA